MTVVLGLGMWLLLATPPFHGADEQAHAGYVWSLIDGELPTIDTAIPPDRGPHLARTVDQETPGSHRTEIYTANNPPLVYALAVPPTLVGRALGVPAPALAALRGLGVVATVVAVWCAHRLGRELATGDETVGFSTATLVAATVGVTAVVSFAGLDGVALAATTAVAWATVRLMRMPTTRSALMLGAVAAVAVGVRPMSAVFAGVGTLIAIVGVAFRDRRLVPAAAVASIGPPVVAWGWYYALNVARYGDPTGSAALFGKMDRATELVRALAKGWPTRNLQVLVTGTSAGDAAGSAVGPVLAVGLGAVVVAAVLLAWRRPVDARRRPIAAPPAVWAAMALLGAVPFVLTHLHTLRGGSAHPRYLLPAVPLAAAAIALVVGSIGRRVAAALSAVSLGAATARTGRLASEEVTGPLGSPLAPLVEGSSVRAAAAVTGVGLVLTVVGAWRVSEPGSRTG